MLPYYLELKDKIRYYIAGTKIPVSPEKEEGDLLFHWQTYIQSGIDVHIEDIPGICDTVVLELGDETVVSDLRALDKDGNILHISKEKGGRICLDLGTDADELIIRIIPDITDIRIKDMRLVCVNKNEKYVFPAPSFMKLSGDTFVPLSAMSFCADDDVDCQVALGTFSLRSEIDVLCGQNGSVRFEKADMQKEGYEIRLSKDGGYVRAGGALGFMYAVEALIQLTSNGFVPDVHVKDDPRFSFRGVHVGVPAREELDFFKLFITEVVLPMHYNTVIIEVGGGMEYKSHPEINEMWETIRDKMASGEWPECPHQDMVGQGSFLLQSEMRELVDFMKMFGLNVIPELNSLSHVQYITKAHPEISEQAAAKDTREAADLREADANYDRFYPDSYCPSNPRSYEIMFDLMDEVIDVFKPTMMHMGHDEVYTYGKCDKCRGRDAEVIAEDIRKLHAHLSEKGIRMVLWGDMMNDVNRYAVPEIIDMIPKDILLLDFIWYFRFEKDTEVRLTDHGFDVAIGNLYASHFPRYESRMKNPKICGGEVSTWVTVTEKRFGFEGKMFDIMMTGDLLCNENHIHDSRRSYARIINDIQPRLRRAIRRSKVRFTDAAKQHIADHAFINKYSLPAEITLKDGAGVSNDLCVVKDSVNVSLYARKASSLLFVWATEMPFPREAWKDPKQIGSVAVLYEDGEEQIMPIEYGVHIYTVNENYGAPLRGKLFRHEGYCGTWSIDAVYEGKSVCGDPCTLYSCEYTLSDKPVHSVSVKVNENSVPILLYGILTDK